MRKLMIGLIAFLIFPLMANAYWRVGNPFRRVTQVQPVNPRIGKTDYPGNYSNNPEFLLCLQKGNLKDTIDEYAMEHNWEVIWHTYHNYPVLINGKISGLTFPIVMDELLHHYPLYAKYDTHARIMWIYYQGFK